MIEHYVEAVWELLQRTDGKDQPRFSKAQQEDAVVVLFIRMRIDLTALQGPARQLLDSFLERVFAGVDDRSDPLSCVEKYLAENPVHPDLMRGFERILGEPAVAPEDGGFAAFSGTKPAMLQPPSNDPTGVRSGPLARFFLNDPTKRNG